MSGMYLSEIAIIAKPNQKMCFNDEKCTCYFDGDKLFEVQESTDQEKKLHILSRLEMTEPKWEFVK